MKLHSFGVSVAIIFFLSVCNPYRWPIAMALCAHFMKNYALHFCLDRIVVANALPEDLQMSLCTRAFASALRTRTRRMFSPILDTIFLLGLGKQ